MCDSSIEVVETREVERLYIAIDYDDTISAAPEMWFKIMCIMNEYGHDVRIVTARTDIEGMNLDIRTFLLGAEDDFPVIYCNGEQKEDVCESQGFFVDIWCDDYPAIIPKRTALYTRVEEMGLV